MGRNMKRYEDRKREKKKKREINRARVRRERDRDDKRGNDSNTEEEVKTVPERVRVDARGGIQNK